MKLLCRFVLPSLLLIATSTNFAAVTNNNGAGPIGSGPFGGGQDLAKLKLYLRNLGSYFGYDLEQSPTPPDNKKGPSASLIDTNPNLPQGVPAVQLINQRMFNSFLGASFLVNTVPDIAKIISDAAKGTFPEFAYVNNFASFSFNPSGLLQTPSYEKPSQTGISVSPLVDQPPYQRDPINQAVLNILGTPDYTYCMDDEKKELSPACLYNSLSPSKNQIMNEYQVMVNVVGTPLPGTYNYFDFTQIQPLLGQLNVNSLITPLMYSTAQLPNTQQQEGGKPGLTALSQQQQAANFVRYASGLVMPLALPDRKSFDKWVGAANDEKSSVAKLQAQAVVANYLTSLRVYAAQVSVGVGNLYFIMSKRLPQGDEAQGTQTSQALSEFNLATWRLYNPSQDGSKKTQWIDNINKASPATVQKEMAVLLAEINYQLYLNRQQEERMLLTNSLLLLQNVKAGQPSSQLNAPATGSPMS